MSNCKKETCVIGGKTCVVLEIGPEDTELGITLAIPRGVEFFERIEFKDSRGRLGTSVI